MSIPWYVNLMALALYANRYFVNVGVAWAGSISGCKTCFKGDYCLVCKSNDHCLKFKLINVLVDICIYIVSHVLEAFSAARRDILSECLCFGKNSRINQVAKSMQYSNGSFELVERTRRKDTATDFFFNQKYYAFLFSTTTECAI